MRPLREGIDQALIQTEQEPEGHHATKARGPVAAAHPPHSVTPGSPAHRHAHVCRSGLYLLIQGAVPSQVQEPLDRRNEGEEEEEEEEEAEEAALLRVCVIKA